MSGKDGKDSVGEEDGSLSGWVELGIHLLSRGVQRGNNNDIIFRNRQLAWGARHPPSPQGTKQICVGPIKTVQRTAMSNLDRPYFVQNQMDGRDQNLWYMRPPSPYHIPMQWGTLYKRPLRVPPISSRLFSPFALSLQSQQPLPSRLWGVVLRGRSRLVWPLWK